MVCCHLFCFLTHRDLKDILRRFTSVEAKRHSHSRGQSHLKCPLCFSKVVFLTKLQLGGDGALETCIETVCVVFTRDARMSLTFASSKCPNVYFHPMRHIRESHLSPIERFRCIESSQRKSANPFRNPMLFRTQRSSA